MTTARESITAKIAALESQLATEKANLEKFGASPLLDMAAVEVRAFFRWIGSHVFATPAPVVTQDVAAAPVAVVSGVAAVAETPAA